MSVFTGIGVWVALGMYVCSPCLPANMFHFYCC